MFMVFPSGNIFAQCIANAGNDTILCCNDSVPQLQLGGNPVVTSGYPPFTYCWETTYQIGSLLFTASDFLNDTTLEHPQLIDIIGNNETLHFILTVTDSLGNQCVDSVNIRFSRFVFLTKNMYSQVTINQGDSTQLYSGISGGIPPLSFLWTPNYNLSDNTVAEPWASPDTTTNYSVFVEDSAGCHYQSGSYFTVNVIPMSIHKINVSDDFTIVPNPTKSNFLVKLSENIEPTQITISNTTRQIIKVIPLDKGQNTYQFTEKLPAGIYFVKVQTDKGTVVKKLIVN